MAATKARIASTKTRVTAAHRYLDYQKFCVQMGYPVPPLPSSATAVGSFLAEFMVRNSNHTASLDGVLSNLRTESRRRGHVFLDAAGETEVRDLVNDWKLCDVSQVNRKAPLRFRIFVEMLKKWDLSAVDQLMRAVMLATGIQLVLRTAEITRGLQAMHFVWHHVTRQVSIFLGPTKTFRHGSGVWVTLADTTHEISAYKLLRRLWEVRRLDVRATEYVFCQVTSTGSLRPSVPLGESGYRRLIKRGVASIGLEAARFSGHSPRAGGATDMFAAGVPYYVIKKYGRWVSDTALIYYRCETSVAAAAAIAFGSGYV